MANRPLAEIITEMIDADRVCLPVHPESLVQVMASIADGRVGSGQLWALVGEDPALICSLFRAANSSFYAGLPKALSIDEAVTRLGLDKAVRIVEETCRNSNGPIQGALLSRYMPSLWQHAQGCATGARWLARRCCYFAIADKPIAPACCIISASCCCLPPCKQLPVTATWRWNFPRHWCWKSYPRRMLNRACVCLMNEVCRKSTRP